MIHILLLLVCILSVEIIFKLDFVILLNSILRVTRKVIYVIPKNNISDHWKEKVIPVYALKIINYSLKIFLILFLIISLFFVVGLFFNNFIALTLSSIGIVESMAYAFGYVYLRKLATR